MTLSCSSMHCFLKSNITLHLVLLFFFLYLDLATGHLSRALLCSSLMYYFAEIRHIFPLKYSSKVDSLFFSSREEAAIFCATIAACWIRKRDVLHQFTPAPPHMHICIYKHAHGICPCIHISMYMYMYSGRRLISAPTAKIRFFNRL